MGSQRVGHDGSHRARTHLQTLHFQTDSHAESDGHWTSTASRRGGTIQPTPVLLAARVPTCRRTEGLAGPCPIHPCGQAAPSGARQRGNCADRFSARQGAEARLPWTPRSCLAPRRAPGHRRGLRSRFHPRGHSAGRGARGRSRPPAGAGKPRGHNTHNPFAKPGGGRFRQDNGERARPHTQSFHRHPMKQSLPSAFLPTAANFLREDGPSLGPRSGRQARGSSFALIHRGAQETGPRVLKCTGRLLRKASGQEARDSP